jgi:dipeptidyl aminopeptidase/acylaminoacyl peptidase
LSDFPHIHQNRIPMRTGTLLFSWILFTTVTVNAQQRAMTFEDVMQFRQIRNSTVSSGGNWVGYDFWPDRGDGEAIFVNTRDPKKQYIIPLGQRPVFSPDEKWAAVAGKPSLAAEETAKKKKSKTYGDVSLIDLTTGAVTTYKNGKAFEFSPDGKWFWVHFNTPDSLEKVYKKNSKRTLGSKLLLKELAGSRSREWPLVSAAAFDSVTAVLAFGVADTAGNNSLRLVFPEKADKDSIVHARKEALYDRLKWHYSTRSLAFVAGDQDKEGKTMRGDLSVWQPAKGVRLLAKADSVTKGWIIPQKADLNWTKDGRFVLFGLRLAPVKPVSYEDSAFTQASYYDVRRILSGIEGDLWHTSEPRIKTLEKKVKDRWKTQFFTAVADLTTGITVQLSDTASPGIRTLTNAHRGLSFTEMPWIKASLWDGGRYDLAVVDYAGGKRTPVVQGIRSPGVISPDGRFVAYWKAPHWFLFEVATAQTVNLTEKLGVRFDDEDHDSPSEPPSYGFGGWTHGARHVLLYDRYDIWMIGTADQKATNITVNGREKQLMYRLVRTDSDVETVAPNAPLLVSATHELKKYQGMYQVNAAKPGAIKLIEEDAKWSFVAKPKKAAQYIVTRQTYRDYPDLYITDPGFKKPSNVTAAGSQTAAFNWGNASLVDWKSTDGRPMQGVLITPGGYTPGTKLPVLVYFYEIMSDRLYDFPAVNIDTRPDFAQFVSNGYAVFLPDIVYRMDGRPMKSAYDCLVPGVQKIIDMGVADPARIGLHGHSWGGTQTTYLISQTNMFKAAIAGAPVTNWVSAYSGIRWESGLARTFQYERSQSRIGASLWEKPELYLDNSAVWHADKIKTPLLLQHGDADGAVPWYQSIELYLALRRLNQPVWFLQYFGEDHHLAKYPNKLDYAMKFKAFFDHYLKDEPMPGWMKEGVPYWPKE